MNDMRQGTVVYPVNETGYVNKGIRFIGPDYAQVGGANRSCTVFYPAPRDTPEVLTVISGSEASYPIKIIYIKTYETYYIVFYNTSKIRLQARRADDDSLIDDVDITGANSASYMRYDYLNDKIIIFTANSTIAWVNPSDITDYTVASTVNYSYPRDLAVVGNRRYYLFQTSNMLATDEGSYNEFSAPACRRCIYVPLTKSVYAASYTNNMLYVIPMQVNETSSEGYAYNLSITAPYDIAYIPSKKLMYLQSDTNYMKFDPITNKASSAFTININPANGGLNYFPWYDVVTFTTSGSVMRYVL